MNMWVSVANRLCERSNGSPAAEFYIALLHIWLEPDPADWKPKDARFGKAG